MNAMIFAAGQGTRLQPITLNKPKALVEIEGCTLLEIAIRKLISFGIKRIVINVHHFADMIIDFVNSKNFAETEIFISDERNQLLDTGGGLVKAKDLFIKNTPVITYNVDIICNINITELIEYHNANKNLVTLFVQHRKASRYLLLNEENRLCGWQNPETGEEKLSIIPKTVFKVGYNCVQIIDYKLFDYIKSSGKFSIINKYLELAETQKIYGWINDNVTWFDIGTPEKLMNTKNYLHQYNDLQKEGFLFFFYNY
jgi:NDP-sugar pyrophosphorylase family protein